MRIKVVTSIVGEGRDNLIDICKDEGIDYIAYTNQTSDVWTTKPPCNIFSEDKKNAKIHKVLIHKYEACDISVWIDGNVKPLQNIRKTVEDLLGDNDMAISRHPNRNNVFEEGQHIINVKVEHPEIVIKQLQRYAPFKDHIINDATLCFATMIIRRHTPQVFAFNDAWWAEICTNSFRDQLSLPIILKQFSGLKANIFDSKLLPQYFERNMHKPITYF